MAYIRQEQEGLTDEQAEILRELNSFHQVSETVAWKQIRARLELHADEAREALMDCLASLEQRGVLALRWQQREATKRDILGFMDSQLSQREKLLEEIKEQNEHSTDDARNYDQ